MKPYFDTHSAGVLLLLVLLAWLSMEAIQFVRQWQWRADATRVRRRSIRPQPAAYPTQHD